MALQERCDEILRIIDEVLSVYAREPVTSTSGATTSREEECHRA
jgi:hypothetical protein